MDDDMIDPNDYADDFNVFEENEIAQDREDFEPDFCKDLDDESPYDDIPADWAERYDDLNGAPEGDWDR